MPVPGESSHGVQGGRRRALPGIGLRHKGDPRIRRDRFTDALPITIRGEGVEKGIPMAWPSRCTIESRLARHIQEGGVEGDGPPFRIVCIEAQSLTNR